MEDYMMLNLVFTVLVKNFLHRYLNRPAWILIKQNLIDYPPNVTV